MASDGWTWARLNGDQLALLAGAEKTLGDDYLLAYQPGAQVLDSGKGSPLRDLGIAPLNASQLECLQGLEAKLQAVVIAYRQTNP